jgi:hypothetical protein
MSSPYALWSIWRQLPMLLKLFFLILSLVSIYTLFSAFVAVVRLRSLTNQHKVLGTSSLQHSLAALRIRAENMRQLVGATFYLFGFIFFLVLPSATVILDNSRTPLSTLILRNLFVDIAFAANTFSVFLVLHFVQWFVSSRLIIYAQHLNAQTVALPDK